MSKNQKTTVAILVAILIIALFGVVYLLTRPTAGPTNPGTGNGNPFTPGTGTGTTNGGNNSENNGGIGVEPSPNNSGTSTPTQPGRVPKLRKISQSPVAGAVAFERNGELVIRYVDQVTGHIYETKGESLTTEKISNTTIPQIKEAIWVPEGDAVYIRYTKEGAQEIETYYARLKKTLANNATSSEVSKTEYEIEGSFLPRDVKNIVFEPSKNRIFSLSVVNRRGIGAISLRDAVKRTEILNTAIKEWNVQWPKDKTITLNTKASGSTEGYLYFLNTDTGNMDGVIAGLKGITTSTNKDLSYVFYSYAADNSFVSSVLNNVTRSPNNAPVKTLAEKCVWSTKETANIFCAVPQTIPQNLYPDAWYQGRVSFNDDLWKVNVSGNLSALLIRPENDGFKSMDMTKLFLDPQEHYVFFINKKDGILWSYDVSEEFF